MNFIRKYELVLALFFALCATVSAQTFTPLPIADSIIVKNLNVKNTEIRDLLQGMAVLYGLIRKLQLTSPSPFYIFMAWVFTSIRIMRISKGV